MREKITYWTEEDGQNIAVERLENGLVEIRLIHAESGETFATATLLPHRWDGIIEAMSDSQKPLPPGPPDPPDARLANSRVA